jgi:tripartite ATP-independent transporter DctM subunit
LIWAGLHVATALLIAGLAGVWAIRGDVEVATSLLARAASDAIADPLFGVVPLFVLMGQLVATADIGRDCYAAAERLFRRLAGGLGVATVAANAVFAAVTGISIASAAVFTRVAVPEMLALGYRPAFAVGVVAGSSILGMLIPPSLLMIVYAFLAEQSVRAMFLAGIVPGLVMALTFSAGILAAARFAPGLVQERAEPAPIEHAAEAGSTFRLLAPVLLLVLLVLGGIYGGFFTATEGGAVGATGAFAIAVARRRLDLGRLWQVLVETGQVTASVLVLIVAASLYARMLALAGLPDLAVRWLGGAGLGPEAFLAGHLLLVLLLGTILDSTSILLVTVPLALPIARTLGFDLVWFGIVTIVAVEIGLLTPPFGLSVYVVTGTLADPRVGLWTTFAGAAPFALAMLAVLLLLIAFPSLVLLPL